MAHEVDILNVNNADAVIFRYYERDMERVIVIDAGNPGDGMKVVNHIKKYCEYDIIDFLVLSHPDSDHVGGMEEVINNIQVDKVWVYDPRRHVDYLQFNWLLESARKQRKAISLVESLQSTFNFIDAVDRKKIKREEPKVGDYFGPIYVIGPSESYYNALLAGFRDVEDLVKDDAKSNDPKDEIDENLLESGRTLDQDNETSNENNSSLILYAIMDDGKYLFPGDAGVQALYRVIDKYDLTDLEFFKVPHHGSKRNLTLDIVSALRPSESYISAEGSRKHPSRAVVNALKKYGNVYSTHKSNSMHHRHNMPQRDDYHYPLEPL